MTTPISLVGTVAPQLEYSVKYALELAGTNGNGDFGNMEISEDNGANWSAVTTDRNGSQGYTGNSTWVRERVDLSQYEGKSILLRLSSSMDWQKSGDGIYFDDIAVVEYTAGATALTKSSATTMNHGSSRINGGKGISITGLAKSSGEIQISSLRGQILAREKISSGVISYNNMELASGVYCVTTIIDGVQMVKQVSVCK